MYENTILVTNNKRRVYKTEETELHEKKVLFAYRIASNKRPTSRKRLPRINAPFFLISFYKRLLRINAPLFKGKEREWVYYVVYKQYI